MEKINKKRYWKSLEEFVDPEKFNEQAEKEFMRSPLQEDAADPVARRDFLKLMGASLALASTACVRRPTQRIVPYSERPHDVIPGKANFYASSAFDNGEFFSTIVRTREGRPISMQGNSAFPLNRSALSARMHAHVVSLYDPDRLKKPRIRVEKDKDFHQRNWNDVTYEKMDESLTKVIDGAKLGMLLASNPSPSRAGVVSDFAKTFSAQVYYDDSINHSEVRRGQELSYGDEVFPQYRFDKAKYIISLGADFLGTYANPTANAVSFAKTRQPGPDMSRLVVFEALMSLTGANADYRIRVKNSDLVKVAMGLAHEIVVKEGHSNYANSDLVKSKLKEFANVAAELNIEKELFSQIAKDIWEQRGKSLVVAGGINAKTEDALALQISCNFLNTILENDGKTVDYQNSLQAFQGSDADVARLIADIESGKIDTLLVSGVNPVYQHPENKKLLQALKKVTLIYSTMYMDETAEMADYILAESHPLEEWGDAEYLPGMYNIQQPTIRPIGDTRSIGFNLMTWAYFLEKGPARLNELESWYDYVRWTWKNRLNALSGDFERSWVALLQAGFVDTKESQRERDFTARRFRMDALSQVKKSNTKSSNYELSLYQKSAIGDGAMANMPWLQEMPDPVTKNTWENYLTISYATAKKEKLKDGDIVSLEVDGKKLKVPVFVQIGQEDSTLGLAVGYGHSWGKVAKGLGVNAWNLAKMTRDEMVTAALPASFTKTGEKTQIANTQGHHHMEGRSIVVEATLKDYLKNPASGIHKHKIFSIWPKHEYKGHKWGMTIDQNACIGCSACVVACQSENNIPVVGKKYVLEGREMQWMRIDRYYSGSALHDDIPKDPEVYFQPMLCQHCDNAPCESVCPVLATTHSPEGINEMTYNRCVGTRYCSNNCPYKVRRFNWFAYTKGDRDIDTPKEAYNPSVTVRSRGVMEKCTFCVHRIEEVKAEHKVQGTSYEDGDVVTACEAACPTDAIVFGDVNDPNSRVSKMQAKKNAYKVLEEWHAQPAVKYLTKIRNKDSISTGHGGDH
tara:strand:+ start:2148 stop:5225 length:3078 start_codon:yes stop_codon:yes gene_type:complete